MHGNCTSSSSSSTSLRTWHSHRTGDDVCCMQPWRYQLKPGGRRGSALCSRSRILPLLTQKRTPHAVHPLSGTQWNWSWRNRSTVAMAKTLKTKGGWGQKHLLHCQRSITSDAREAEGLPSVLTLSRQCPMMILAYLGSAMNSTGVVAGVQLNRRWALGHEG